MRAARAMTTPPLTLGTAGHIDHGKTALVAALTGVDTDRLPAEKARGISIELGYAPLRLPSGRRLSVVDVPGHERFVRTMVAGATGIDLYLMVVAADDGVMPQTREHAAVLAALGVGDGVVAVTKADLADPARAGARRASCCPRADGRAVLGAHRRRRRGRARRPRRRRRLACPGAATAPASRCCTSTAPSPSAAPAPWSPARCGRARLRPATASSCCRPATPVRVRSVQVHDEPVERAAAGQRVAAQPRRRRAARRRARRRRRRPGRGGALAGARLRRSTLRDAAHGMRAHVHHGTRETPARLADLGDGLWQARLEQPLLARAGDRVVVRSIAPPDTLGGGVVLDPAARRHGRRADVLARLERLRRGEPEPEPEPPPAAGRRAGRRPRRRRCRTPPSRSRSACAPPATSRPNAADLEADDLAALRAAGRAVRVGRAMYAHPDALAAVRARVEAVIAADGAITLARLRDELQTSRKFAQALLEHLDAERVTKRLPGRLARAAPSDKESPVHRRPSGA